MNTRRLEYFLTLTQTQSLRKAAELLHISPPALSKAMKQLEQEMEISLWTRTEQKMLLTPAGKKLAKRVPQLIQEIRALRDDLTHDRQEQKPIRIGTFEVFSTYFLTHLEAVGFTDHKFELHELLPGEIEKNIALGNLDLGLTYMPVPEPSIELIKVGSIEMGVFAREGAFKDLPQEKLPFVTPVFPIQGTPTRVRGLDGWPDDAYQRDVKFQVTLLESALELCRLGKAAAFFPVFIAEEHNKRVKSEYRLSRRRASFPCRVRRSDVYLVKPKAVPEDAMTRLLAKAVRKLN